MTRQFGIAAATTPTKRGRPRVEPGEREQKMRSLFFEGKSLAEIGRTLGFTGAHVGQLLKKTYGIRGEDGGMALRARKARARLEIKRVAYAKQHFDLPYEDYRRLVKHPGQPTRKFAAQRKNAGKRGIGWEITFAQWWKVWEDSGHWGHRGPGQGYVMCRYGDEGPYAVGNVFIAPGIVNCSDKVAKQSGLPIGVSVRRGKFLALRMIDGRRYRLGLHNTPELAHAAYLSLGPIGAETRGGAA